MNQYVTGLIIQSAITVITVAGMFGLTGLAGMVSFGQAAFMAIAAYATSLSWFYLHLPFPIACVAGILVTVLVALFIGAPTLRLRKDYFSLITVGLNEAIIALVLTFSKWTSGATGFSRIPLVKGRLAIAIIAMVGVIWMMYNFKNSRFGRMCIALKNDELAAKSFGIKVYELKLKVYIVSCIIAGVGGIIYALQTRVIDPYSFGWSRSSEMVIYMFFGGTNSLIGSSLSAFVLKLMPELLRGVEIMGRSIQEYRIAIYSVLILLIINFRPGGLFGEWEPSLKSLAKLFGKKQKPEGE